MSEAAQQAKRICFDVFSDPSAFTEREVPQEAAARPPHYDTAVKEKYGLPTDWEGCCWEIKGREGPAPFFQIKGGVYKTFRTRGPCKGEKDYRKPEAGTECTVSIPKQDFKAWLQQWESDTGLYAECSGSGRAWAGSSATQGTRYRECHRCNGSGRAIELAKAQEARG